MASRSTGCFLMGGTGVLAGIGGVLFARVGLACSLGFALGSAAGLFGSWALALLTRFLAKAGSGSSSAEKPGTALTILAFILKLPVIIGLAAVAATHGESALAGFLGGISLVYFGLIGWALARAGAH